ncbi:MAG: GNAT family N-acetyltransferase [Nitrososphaerales archaeon]
MTGIHVRLEPLDYDHVDALLQAGEGFDWAWMSMDLSSRESMLKWIDAALKAQERNEEYPFVVKLLSERNRIIGSTRYLDVQCNQKGVEVGWTWYSPAVWGTPVNPESKFLLLKHAFEDWGAIRVQLKTDSNNLHSQRAILKLGAKFEGRLRNHRIRQDGTFRDSMIYSIIDSEWPKIRSGLLKRISY